MPQVPTTGDAEARQRFLALREEFLRDGGHAQEFTAIADEYAGDPVAPFALLYAGVAAQQAGEAATAATCSGVPAATSIPAQPRGSDPV